MAPQEDDEYSAEGKLLHRHMADRTLPREGLTDDQREVLTKAETLESEFVATVLAKH